jgi:hypothetical protein
MSPLVGEVDFLRLSSTSLLPLSSLHSVYEQMQYHSATDTPFRLQDVVQWALCSDHPLSEEHKRPFQVLLEPGLIEVKVLPVMFLGLVVVTDKINGYAQASCAEW